MLRAIYSIAMPMRQKKMYIYGINKDAITVFTNLAFWGADIKGFIDDEGNRYVGEQYMNRPIISLEMVKEIENVIVVIPEMLERSVAKAKFGSIEVFYSEEIIAPDEELKKKDVYIYGIGAYGEKIYKQFCEYGIQFKAACVSKKGSVSIWHKLPVYEISEINETEDCAFIIATERPVYREQMLEMLAGYKGDKCVYNYILQHHISEGRFFQVIGRAVSEHKEIWVYERDRDLADKVIEILSRYSVKVRGKINDLYDLGYDSIENVVVIIAETDEYEVEQACNILDSLGFALENWDYTSLVRETVKCVGRVEMPTDMLLRWSNVSDNPDYPGFIVHGNDRKEDIRIMVTGGSTSTDNIYRTESWVKLFYDKLVSEDYKVTVFNSATCGHGVARELLHLLRDGAYMGLDYVISLSGVNNTVTHGVKNYFSDDVGAGNNVGIYGLASRESLYEFWIRNVKIMRNAAELYGAKYFPFLQPMAVKEEMSLFKSVMHETRNCRKGILEYRRSASMEDDSIYINMVDLLDNEENMYIDNCHYSNQANRLIANFIYETIINKEGAFKKNNVAY